VRYKYLKRKRNCVYEKLRIRQQNSLTPKYSKFRITKIPKFANWKSSWKAWNMPHSRASDSKQSARWRKVSLLVAIWRIGGNGNWNGNKTGIWVMGMGMGMGIRMGMGMGWRYHSEGCYFCADTSLIRISVLWVCASQLAIHTYI